MSQVIIDIWLDLSVWCISLHLNYTHAYICMHTLADKGTQVEKRETRRAAFGYKPDGHPVTHFVHVVRSRMCAHVAACHFEPSKKLAG